MEAEQHHDFDSSEVRRVVGANDEGRVGRNNDRGQALILVVFPITLALMSVLVIAALAGAEVARARAVTAADAAALAGSLAGRRAAEEIAEANGARLEKWHHEGAAVEVGVTRREARATARAERVSDR